MDPLRFLRLRRTPQSEPADASQVPNSAGGYTFAVTPMAQLRRFLVLGTEGGTFYVDQRALTKENAGVLMELARSAGRQVVDEVVEISVQGRAPKQNPALFALAAVSALGDEDARRHALDSLPRVARTGTHLFLFAEYVEQFRGWGRGLRKAVARWYADKDPDRLALQMVKYRQREGWSHRDLLRLAHPAAPTPQHEALYDWACERDNPTTPPALLEGYRLACAATTAQEWAKLVGDYRLTWEMLPSQALNEPLVWEALLDGGMPQTALMRQLPRLTQLGLLDPMGERLARVVQQLTDGEHLTRARVHPLAILVALRTYASGHGLRGKGTWQPVSQIVDALDEAFYLAFGNVVPANKRTLLALDVSGSMAYGMIAGMPVTPREATAALALLAARTEPVHHIMAFSHRFVPVTISPRMRLDTATAAISNLPFERTDCALPMVWAQKNQVDVDTFVVLTDNETWAGDIHPHQALRSYRNARGTAARLVVVGMTATTFSIADPADAGQLDVVGFDTATPDLISAFSRGEV